MVRTFAMIANDAAVAAQNSLILRLVVLRIVDATTVVSAIAIPQHWSLLEESCDNTQEKVDVNKCRDETLRSSMCGRV